MKRTVPRQQRPGHAAATVQGHITFDAHPDAVDLHLAPTTVLRRLIEAARSDPYVRYLDEWKPEPVIVERPVASRKGWYAGTLDTVVRLPDGRVCLDDIKTTRSGVYGETALQIAAYRYAEFYLDPGGAERPMTDLGITHTRVVWVRADGYDVIPVAADEAAFRTFKYVATVARAARGLDNLIGQPIYQGEPS